MTLRVQGEILMDAEQAKAELRATGTAAKSTSRDLRALGAEGERAARGMDTTARATAAAQDGTREMSAELIQLRARFDPLFAMSQRYEAELSELNRAQRLGALTARQYDAALDRLNADFARHATGARGLASANQAVAASNRLAAGSMGNLVAQGNDVIQMLMAGQNPLQLAVQQGTQITQVIGPLGAAGAFRALGGAVMGMLSPISLITIGAIAATAAVVNWFRSGIDEAQSFADRVETLGNGIDSLRDRIEEASRTRVEMARFEDRRRMTDAGVYVEPESGRVRISGVDTTQARQSEVEARFDAMQSEFSLKASLSEVYDAIAAATLPEAQLGSLTELQARVSDVEITASAQDESIDLITTTLEVNGSLVTMSSVTARLDNAENQLALRVTNDEFSDLTARTTDVELTLGGLDVPGFQFAVSDQRRLRDATVDAQNQTVEAYLANWLDARAQRVAQADARMGLTAFVNEQFEAEAAQRLELDAQIGEARADLAAERFARADGDAAEALARGQLAATLANGWTRELIRSRQRG